MKQMKNLKKLRNGQGLTQQRLAELVGTNQQAINSYENRGIEPDLEMLMKLADCLGSSVDYMIGHTDIPAFLLRECDFVISKDEIEMIKQFRKLSPVTQNHLRELIKESAKS